MTPIWEFLALAGMMAVIYAAFIFASALFYVPTV
jgi:hypothetical protein